MQQFLKSTRLVAASTTVALLALSGCSGGVGDGDTIEKIEIVTTDGVITGFQCFYSGLRAIATFKEGGREDVTLRGTWKSSDPSAVAVSNGDLISPAGFRVSKGTIAPKAAAPATGVATISFSFVGLNDAALVNIEPASLEITPSTFTLVEGLGVGLVANGLLGDSSMDELSLIFANQITNWTVDDALAAEVSTSEGGRLGGSVTTNDVTGDTAVTVTAVTDMADCDQPGQAGHATATVNIVDERFDKLEFRSLSLGAPRANSDPLIATMAQGTSQLFRVLGVTASGFTQDVTSRILNMQGSDSSVDEGVFSDNTDALFLGAGQITTLALDTEVDVALTARLEQLDTTVETAAAEMIKVTPAVLQEIAITPADGNENAAPDTTISYLAQGTYDIAPTTQDLTVTAVFISDDIVNAAASSAGRIVVDGDAADGTTGIQIDAESQDDPFLDAASQTTINSADSGNSGNLNIVSITQGSDLLVDFYPDGQQPRDTVCPDVDGAGDATNPDGDVNNDIYVGTRCFLRAIADNGQDVSVLAIWESSDPSVGVVGNASPLISEFSARSAGTTTVTARLFNDEGEQIASDTFDVTVN